jgi:hypothetical protein
MIFSIRSNFEQKTEEIAIPALESASLNEHATILTTKYATLISNR